MHLGFELNSRQKSFQCLWFFTYFSLLNCDQTAVSPWRVSPAALLGFGCPVTKKAVGRKISKSKMLKWVCLERAELFAQTGLCVSTHMRTSWTKKVIRDKCDNSLYLLEWNTSCKSATLLLLLHRSPELHSVLLLLPNVREIKSCNIFKLSGSTLSQVWNHQLQKKKKKRSTFLRNTKKRKVNFFPPYFWRNIHDSCL